MNRQHSNVKALREVRRGAGFTMLDHQVAALEWAIRVCEAADNLVNGKGRHHSEQAYRRLEEVVNHGNDQVVRPAEGRSEPTPG